ncbi:hypothetical protein [Candidatus Nitrospira inopinata]|jgi:hypothetical protein|uniref:Uncharacterized protein n=1 Tax=Candidatus Nitrospira inopinata TaxID=1715989 RepID=A0A0S4KTW1_9BACT|nr:hypothetical protein [Candidatus Nitrospira inopinata]CUQ67215.1 conserved protein of unknown function [Candidatus Nitrospira inopinata]
MAEPALDKHQLAGFDPRERGFSRAVEFESVTEGYQAILRYETVRVTTEPRRTQDDALLALIALLHEQGYRQLKTQKSFHKGAYLGSREPWVEYPDPPHEPERRGVLARLLNWFGSTARVGEDR